VVAVSGARSADLEVQVARALQRPVDVTVIIIGANDVTHRVPIASAARDLGRAVRTLRAAGSEVVVGTCPDLGTVKPVMQPLWSADRFHPSPDGYRRIVDAILPSALDSLGVTIPVSVSISDSVQDVQLAARVASREPGVEVDPLPEAEGVGRLARLRRRLPLVGRGAPEGPTDPAELEQAETG
jgi:hypothetical protein